MVEKCDFVGATAIFGTAFLSARRARTIFCDGIMGSVFILFTDFERVFDE